MSFLDSHGKTVPSHIALDASGHLRPGFRRASEVIAQGERLSFDIMTRDAAATGTVFLTDVIEPLDAAAVVAVIRDARYSALSPKPSPRGKQCASPPNPLTISDADNAHVASALRTARYL